MRITQLTVGDILLKEAEDSIYFRDLYQKLLIRYTNFLFSQESDELSDEGISDLLRFADIFSKSNSDKSELHKCLAQDIVVTLVNIYKENKNKSTIYDKIVFYEREILNTVSNYFGVIEHVKDSSNYVKTDIMSHIANGYRVLNNKVGENEYLFDAQQVALKNLQSRQYYSFSAPTSMGKTYIIKNFIKEKVLDNTTKNIAIIIPTKALINELENDLQESLDTKLQEQGYIITTIPTQLQLLKSTKKILIFTPERMLQSINDNILETLDYIFIDEAQKAFEDDERSPIYYKLLEYFNKNMQLAKIFFSSPYAENPEELLNFITNPYLKNRSELKSSNKFDFSPVSQKQFLCNENKISILNGQTRQLLEIQLSKNCTWIDYIKSQSFKGSSIVYCKSKPDVIDYANRYAKELDEVEDSQLEPEIKTLIKKIKSDIHEEYYLIPLLKKRIAFHIGIIPSDIRKDIEKLVKEQKIKTVFCTSTLLEGVNLPAVNIFVMSYKKSSAQMSPLEFKNLIGRAGRIRYGLWGNVFLISPDNENNEKYKEYLNSKIAKNSLVPKVKGHVNDLIPSIYNSNYILEKKNETYAEYIKFIMYRNLAIEAIKTNDTDSVIYTTYKKQIDAESGNKIIDVDLEDIRDICYPPEVIANIKKAIENEEITLPQIQIIEDIDSLSEDEERKEQINKMITENKIEIQVFLNKLKTLFRFDLFERKDELSRDSNIPHYANLTARWIMGQRLSRIILAMIWYYKQRGYIRLISWDESSEEKYVGNAIQNNFIINETMGDLENIITYKIGKYVRKFIEIYKAIKNDDGDCNIADYLDYGTTNSTIIFLQKLGINRELAKEIYRKGFYKKEENKILITNKNKLLEMKDYNQEVSLLVKNLSQIFE